MNQQPFGTVSVPYNGGNLLDLTYLLREENGRFGVQIVLRRGGKCEKATADGLTDSQTTALALLAILRRNTVTPCALGDVLSDWQEKNAKKDRHLEETLVK